MLYPDLETYREYDASPEFDSPSCLERNCNQIFVKGPGITREILGKMNSEIVPKRTFLFGRDRKTKSVIYVTGLCLLLSLSVFGAIVAWFTDVYNNMVISNLMVTSNKSTNYKMWQNPSPKLHFKVYIFNYTNVDKFKAGWDRKLKVKQLGPYVYEQQVEKVNVTFNNNDTVSYHMKTSYTFLPTKSKGKQSDQIIVPNIPLLVGAALTEYQNYFSRLAFSGILSGLDEQPFVQLPADSFLMGYSSRFYELAKALSSFQEHPTPEKVGIFSADIGVDPNVITANFGTRDKFSLVERFNGQDHFNYYTTNECNKIESSDSAMYPPKKVQQKEDLSLFFYKMCRRIPLVFNKETSILKGKIPAYQYSIPEDIFDSADEKPENQCYCDMSGQCSVKGLFNVTACQQGMPLFVSHPHFHRGDSSLFKYIEGLEPTKHPINNVFNLHPLMGFTMTGRISIQFNIQVRKPYGVQQVEMFKDNTMLPMIWVETVLEEETLPQDFKDLIHESTTTVNRLRLALKYGTLLTALVTLVFITLVWIRRHKKSRLNATRTV